MARIHYRLADAAAQAVWARGGARAPDTPGSAEGPPGRARITRPGREVGQAPSDAPRPRGLVFEEGRVRAEDDGVEEQLGRHEVELGVVRADGYDAAAIVGLGVSAEAAGRFAFGRAGAPERFGRGLGPGRTGAERHSRAGSEAFVGLQRAEVFERVDEDVTVDARAEAGAGLAQRAHVGQAVAEIALGGRADANERSFLAEEPRLVREEVRRVNGDEPRRQDVVVC